MGGWVQAALQAAVLLPTRWVPSSNLAASAALGFSRRWLFYPFRALWFLRYFLLFYTLSFSSFPPPDLLLFSYRLLALGTNKQGLHRSLLKIQG